MNAGETASQWICNQKHDQREYDQIRVEQDENPGVIEAPLAAHAAAGLGHSPCRGQQRRDLPGRSVKFFNVRKSREQEARNERGQREHNAAYE